MHCPAIELHRLVILMHRPVIELHRVTMRSQKDLQVKLSLFYFHASPRSQKSENVAFFRNQLR